FFQAEDGIRDRNVTGVQTCALPILAHSIAWAEKNAPQLKTVVVNTDVYHNGGANDIQEVAYAMNAAVTYMRAMERRGIDVNTFRSEERRVGKECRARRARKNQ